jgi:hypothetical protein
MKQGFSIDTNQITTSIHIKDTFVQKKSNADRQREKQVVIEEVTELTRKLNRAPIGEEFPHKNSAARLFGSWKGFLLAAEIEPIKPTYSNDELIHLVQQLAETLNRVPFGREFPQHKVAEYRFGNWNKFLDAAGLQPNKQMKSRKKIYSNEEIIQSFSLLSKKLGRTPSVREFPHYRIALNRFGNWNNFLNVANATPTKNYTKISNE